MPSRDDPPGHSRTRTRTFGLTLWLLWSLPATATDDLFFEPGPKAILEVKCSGCHGPYVKNPKAKLDLTAARSILAGGESGPALVPGKPDESLIWEKIAAGEMPPKGSKPLDEAEKEILKRWIAGGAKFRSVDVGKLSSNTTDHWSFRRMNRPTPPTIAGADKDPSPIDRFLLAKLREKGLSFAPEASRRELARRLYLDLIGLPPTPEEVDRFLNDKRPDAYERLVDELLASPRYGERWGRQWLDVVGYADSNGYIRHDSPRPLAYHYRDYVIRSLNRDKPLDRFWTEQLAGDELVNYPSKKHLSEDERDALIATHYLRNAPDGTDNTEGNEITRVMERYAVLESQLQITMSAMFGVTIDCARCHSHKFDPIPQRDYYSLQSLFYPAFNVKNWKQPKDRWIHAVGSDDVAAWKASKEACDRDTAALRAKFDDWLLAHRPPGEILFRDDFSSDTLKGNWSDTAPGDETPAGKPPVKLDGETAPAASSKSGKLSILAASPGDSVWLVTKRTFDWTPNEVGGWIQATFKLVESRGGDGKPAERVGYYIALNDHDDSKDKSKAPPSGNILIDGSRDGGAPVNLDYPGKDQKGQGAIGKSPYLPGRSFGVRVTRVGQEEFLLEQVVDGRPEPGNVRLKAEQLPDGGFGFELCCSRSFVVDDVVIETSVPLREGTPEAAAQAGFLKEKQERAKALEEAIAAVDRRRLPEPEKIAWATDLSDQTPAVPLLKRGDYFQHGPAVTPGALSALVDEDNPLRVEPPGSGAKTTGRRLAFAKWATRPGSRASALLARVQVDRLWRGHFGKGLVPTPENFGAAGERPTHPELLEWLADELVKDGWKQKPTHRRIVTSRAYRQTGVVSDEAANRDADDALYSRYPVHRLEAESIRDAMLSAAGVINLKAGGPAVDFVDPGTRQIVLPAPKGPGPHEVNRRSIYVKHRRTQPLTFLQVFDQATPEPNCAGRSNSTVVAQSLAMLNSEFAVRMGNDFAARLELEAGPKPNDRIRRAFLVAFSREPEATELSRCREFLALQSAARLKSDPTSAEHAALADLCRMLLATNEFIHSQ